MVVWTCSRKEEEEAGVQRARRRRRIPATVSYPDATTDTGAEASAPLRATRRTWHAPPLCPSPPLLHTDKEAFAAGRHFQKSCFAYEIYLAAGGSAAALASHVTHISAQQEHGLERRRAGADLQCAIVLLLLCFMFSCKDSQ